MNTEHTEPTYDKVKKRNDATRLSNALKRRDELEIEITRTPFTDKGYTALINEYNNTETLIERLTNKKR